MSERQNHIDSIAQEYDMCPSRVQAEVEHKYGALFIAPVGYEWEVHGFNTIDELNTLLHDYLGEEFDKEKVDRIVDLDTGNDVPFEASLTISFTNPV